MPITPESILAGMQPFIPFGKGSQTSEGAGTIHSLWKAGGGPPAGVNPPLFSSGSSYVPTKATTGALGPYSNPATGNAYPGHCWVWGLTPGMLVLYDRVWACSGFATNTTNLQTVVGQSDAGGGRYATFEGIELWLEVYTAPGATGATWTITYTNLNNVSGRTAQYAHPANAESVGQMMPLALQNGDAGVRSVQSLQCSVSSGTAGDIGITLVKKLCAIPIRTDGQDRDALGLGLERIPDDACIAMQVGCSTTNTGLIQGQFKFTHVVP
jgi:hypothetical protein